MSDAGSRSWAKAVVPVLLTSMVLVWCVRSGPLKPSGPAPVASASAPLEGMPLLEGLKTGDVVGEWTVERLQVETAPDGKPQLAIQLNRKGSGISVWLHRKEAIDNPPVATARYAFTFGHPRPYGEAIPADAYQKVMDLLAERVRRAEQAAPVPLGL